MPDIPDYVTTRPAKEKKEKVLLSRTMYANRIRALYDRDPNLADVIHKEADEILLEALSDLEYTNLVKEYKALREEIDFGYE